MNIWIHKGGGEATGVASPVHKEQVTGKGLVDGLRFCKRLVEELLDCRGHVAAAADGLERQLPKLGEQCDFAVVAGIGRMNDGELLNLGEDSLGDGRLASARVAGVVLGERADVSRQFEIFEIRHFFCFPRWLAASIYIEFYIPPPLYIQIIIEFSRYAVCLAWSHGLLYFHVYLLSFYHGLEQSPT